MSADNRGAMSLSPQAVLGLLIIAYGLLATAGNLGWVDSHEVLGYWPIGLVVLGMATVGRAQELSGRVAGGFLLGAGVLLTAARFFHWHVNAGILWPLFLVAMGFVMMLRGQGRGREQDDRGVVTTDQQLSGVAFWSGMKRNVTSQAFKRGDVTAVMGGIELDLRAAATSGGEAVIDVFAVMGGIQIRVPPDWAVSNQIVAVMGGVEDRSTGAAGARNRLVLRGFVMMGGVEVKA